jgi:hypothetical protein
MDDIIILTNVQPKFDYVIEKEDKISKKEQLRRHLREKFIQHKKEKGDSCNLFGKSDNIYVYAHWAYIAAAAAA